MGRIISLFPKRSLIIIGQGGLPNTWNLMGRIVDRQFATLRADTFESGSDLMKYFEMLPDGVPVRYGMSRCCGEKDPTNRIKLQEELRSLIRPGSIDVNIMTKCDRINYDRNGSPPGRICGRNGSLTRFCKQ